MTEMGSKAEGQACHGHLMEVVHEYAAGLRDLLGDRLVSVVLFGSVARGEAGPYSDIDLLIVIELLPAGRFARKDVLAALDPMVDAKLVDLERQGCFHRLCRLIKTKEEAARIVPLYLDLTEDAVLVYDREGFFAAVLARLRARLQVLGAVRKRMGKVRYWDLNPDWKPGERVEL